MDNLRYPIGKFEWGKTYTAEDSAQHIKTIKKLPKRLKKAVKALSKHQIDQPYRPEGWTARQVVHHVADSHMNAFIRFKLALTEDTPTIKPYFEDRWSAMKDETALSAKPSLKIIKNLHERWVYLMEQMQDSEFERCYLHPELQKKISLREVLALYDWHSRHHLAHIQSISETAKAAEKAASSEKKDEKKNEKIADDTSSETVISPTTILDEVSAQPIEKPSSIAVVADVPTPVTQSVRVVIRRKLSISNNS